MLIKIACHNSYEYFFINIYIRYAAYFLFKVYLNHIIRKMKRR